MTAAADQPKLIVAADAEALAQAAAERVMARIAANAGRIAICLTGGSSPKRLYQLLGSNTAPLDAFEKYINRGLQINHQIWLWSINREVFIDLFIKRKFILIEILPGK